MQISLEQVRHVAELARLELGAGEEEELTAQLNRILEFMAQLGELDTAGVEPTAHVLPLENALREDVVAPSLDPAAALANAPAAVRGHFAVPKIIE